MDTVYCKMCDLVPAKSCQKFRRDSDYVIVTNFSNKMIYLNATAGEVYLLCDGEKSIQEICSKMLTDYQVEESVLQADLVKIIRDLQWNRVIRLSKRKS